MENIYSKQRTIDSNQIDLKKLELLEMKNIVNEINNMMAKKFFVFSFHMFYSCIKIQKTMVH